MSIRRASRRTIRALCAEVHPDDGVDPRPRTRKAGARRPVPAASRPDRKTLQLCRQVAETLGDVLAGQCDDEVLQGLVVVGVAPAPNASRLMVTVRALGPEEPGRILAHLEYASGRLRSEVAAAITRRKTPALAFRLALPPEVDAQEA
ncbi:MAG TPA: ribosome-binding factor A [Isosphaeraceae bacterium]